MEENITYCSMTDCTKEGKPERITDTMELTLCRDHVWDLFAHQAKKAREAVVEIEEQGLLSGPTKGFTYVVRVNNGNVKIGKGGTKKKPLKERLQDLSTGSTYNGGIPVHVLAVLPGGTSTELLTHNQWLHLRVPGRMEQFYADPSLLKWAEEKGIHPDAKPEVDAFLHEWQAMRHSNPTKNNAEGQEERLGIPTANLTGELAKDPLADWTQEIDDTTEGAEW
ncbi:hypothetical protein [Streptomyces sp. NPDC056010]|uniref:hypothetical protein n=1 Tax=Streptomyces sp. NPDC056010 TaxID=3345679 RepID=UPI0035DBE9C7